MDKTNGAFVVSWDFNHGKDKELVIVAERKNNMLHVIGVWQGQEARNIYEMLNNPTIKEEETNE